MANNTLNTRLVICNDTPTAVSGNAGSATKLQTARTIDGVSFNGTANITHYGECTTAAATQAKVVSVTGFTLATGARAMIKFTVTNTVGNPTLNINGTGEKPIYYRGAAISADYLAAKRVYEFVYDGTNYELVGDINTDTNSDTKVTNTLNTTAKAYITGTTSNTTNTGTQVFDTGVYLDTTAGTLTATTFKGALSGKATSAGTADKATTATSADKATTATTASKLGIGGVKTSSTVTSTNGLTACPIISGIPYYKDTNTTYTLSSITGTLAVSKGGTGSTTATNARTNLGAINFVSQSYEPSNQNVGDLWFKEE